MLECGVLRGQPWSGWGRDEEAVRCFERAMGEDDREGIALGRLARLYQKRDDTAEAVKYWRLVLQKQDELERGDVDGGGGGGGGSAEEIDKDNAAMGDSRDEQTGGAAVSDRLSQSAEALEAITYLVGPRQSQPAVAAVRILHWSTARCGRLVRRTSAQLVY